MAFVERSDLASSLYLANFVNLSVGAAPKEVNDISSCNFLEKLSFEVHRLDNGAEPKIGNLALHLFIMHLFASLKLLLIFTLFFKQNFTGG